MPLLDEHRVALLANDGRVMDVDRVALIFRHLHGVGAHGLDRHILGGCAAVSSSSPKTATAAANANNNTVRYDSEIVLNPFILSRFIFAVPGLLI